MADTGTKQSTSFRQFEFCPLCKVNHKKRKKHVYSKHHQQILQSIVKKFSAKIQSVRQNLFNPKVEESEFEFGAKFWCYFCQSEFLKHDLLELSTVIGAGLLEHIASEDHKTNMIQFFWDNLLDKKLKPRFILSQEDLHISKKAAFLAVKKFQKAKSLERQKMAEKLQLEEQKYRYPAAVGQLNKDDDTSQQHQQSNLPTTSSERPISSYRRTLKASGPGLTSIIQKKEDDDNGKQGNVHTGAIPPWLQTDTPSNSSQEIGPTMADYQKHLERERKAKLPSTRVGANFDHTSASASDWLPSFGRVWGKGRRLQSKIHFEKEWKGSHKFKSTSKSSSSATASPQPSAVYEEDSVNHEDTIQNIKSLQSISDHVQVKPYKRKSKGAGHSNSSCTVTNDGNASSYSGSDFSNSVATIIETDSFVTYNPGYSHRHDLGGFHRDSLHTDTAVTSEYNRHLVQSSIEQKNVLNAYETHRHLEHSSTQPRQSHNSSTYSHSGSELSHSRSEYSRNSSTYPQTSSEFSHNSSIYTNRSATYSESASAKSYTRKSKRAGNHDNTMVPYKKRSEGKNTSSTQLLQTPLLADYT